MSINSNAAKIDFDSLWNYDNPAETESKFRELANIAQSSGDTAHYVELMTQIARTQGLQQKFDEAHATLDSVSELLSSAGERAHVRFLLERGRVFNSSGNPTKAESLFVEAFESTLKDKFDFYSIDAAHMLGIVAPSPDKQMEWSLKALDLAEKSHDIKAQKWKGSLYNNIGWTYFDSKKYDLALSMFQKGVEFRREQGKSAPIRIAEYCIGKTLRMQGQIDSAFAIQQRLQKEWLSAGEDNDGYVYEEIGECLLALNRNDEATPYFARAYELLSKDIWIARDEPTRLQRLKDLGKK